MTQIDARNNLAALIRRQVSSLGNARGGGALGARLPPAGTAAHRAASRDLSAGSGDITALVARRVKAIDSQDPQRNRKAFRVFLESVLLAELGDNLINDAGFHQLVDDVQARMNGDPGLAADIRQASDLMLAAAQSADA